MGGDPYCCELLLHEHATVSCKDENGWQEIHQVGKIHFCLELNLQKEMCQVYSMVKHCFEGHLGVFSPCTYKYGISSFFYLLVTLHPAVVS